VKEGDFMSRWFIVSFIGAMLASGTVFQNAPASPPPNPAQRYEDAEAYKVYSAALANSDKPMLIQLETWADIRCLNSVRAADKQAASAFDDYVKVNETKWVLQNKFNFPKPPKLVGPEEIRAMFVEQEKEYQKGGPVTQRGYFILSAVGFNAEKTIAVVNIYYTCGGLCSDGFLTVLRKTDGIWTETIEDQVCVVNS